VTAFAGPAVAGYRSKDHLVLTMGSTPPGGTRNSQPILGGLFLAAVLWRYGSALRHGAWPASHPWSGIALSLLAVQFFFFPLKRNVFGVGLWLASLGSALLWVLSYFSAADDEPKPPAGSSPMEIAAFWALAEAAKHASHCHPKGEPVGSGQVRVVYAQDGSVQSVDLLTEEFRDTVTGACVRTIFRRAKIPAFSEPGHIFIKSFTIVEE